MSNLSPERFGPYDVIGLVAEGSLGQVFQARHVDLDRIAAVKVLAPAVRDLTVQRERLRAEAATLAGLDHPNIVALYDYVEDDDATWLAEQWVHGATLAAVLEHHGRLTPEQALSVIHGATTGLAYAHAAGIVHRDISANNILADEAGTSMLVDFGIAAPIGSGSASGTPAYLSPEAAEEQPLTPASDVYSLAALLYHLLVGTPPFSGTLVELLRHHRATPPPPLRGHGEAMADLVDRSLAKDMARRPANAAAFLAELEEAATRRYGAAWLGRGSIAALVATTISSGLGTGAALTTGATGVAGAGGAAETVLLSTGVGGSKATPGSSASTTQRPTPQRGFGKLAIIGGAAATLLLVGGAAALTMGDDDKNSSNATVAADASDAPSTEPTREPAPEPTAQDTAPSGTWRLVITTTKSNNTVFPVDEKERYTWRMTPTCPTDDRCKVAVRSSSGNELRLTWDGTALVRDSGRDIVEGPCVDPSGSEVPGTWGRNTSRWGKLRMTGDGMPGSTSTTFSGEVTTTVSVVTRSSGTEPCRNGFRHTGSLRPKYTESWVLTARES